VARKIPWQEREHLGGGARRGGVPEDAGIGA
jgi:hypothetical protein